MKRYLVKLTPIGAYTFGTEQNYAFPGEDYGKPTYTADTGFYPEQTTLLGMIRFEILKYKGVVKNKSEYTSDEKAEIDKLIGGWGFDYEKDNPLGIIKKISPMFLIKETKNESQVLIKTPFNHLNIPDKDTTVYEPMSMNETVITSYGEETGMKMPGKIEINTPSGKKMVHQYDVKRGYTNTFLNISTGKLEDSYIFNTITQTRNWTSHSAGTDTGLFRVNKVLMAKDYSFGIEVELEEACLPEQSVVQMGKNGSLFHATFNEIPLEEDPLEVKVTKVLCNNPLVKQRSDVWYYALSDLILEETDYKKFCIVEEKSIRNINQNGKKSMTRQNMVSSGSVFFEDKPIIVDNKSLAAIGYNQIIKITAMEE